MLGEGAQNQAVKPADSPSTSANPVDGEMEAAAGKKLQLFQFSDPAEIEMLVALSAEGHRETRYGYLPFSEEKFRRRTMGILKRAETNVGFYVVLNQKIVGLIDVGLGEPFLAEGGCIASCRSFYVSKDVRQSLVGGKVAAILLSEAKKWATAKGADELMAYDKQGFVTRMLKGGEVDGANVVVKL